jgi:ribosomal protein S6--L-glutamate ligase
MSELNILVIATGYPSKLLETIKKRGHTYTLARPGDFDLYLSDNPKGFDKVFLFGNRMVASKYDAVITRIGENRAFASAIIRQLQHHLGMFRVQSGAAIETCADKFKSAQIISEKHLKVPRQVFSMTGRYPAMYVDKLGGLPMILKELSGSKGKGLIILESPLQTNMTMESYFGSNRKIILQEFLNNGGTDERHIVCGGKVVNSMRRHSPSNDIRANLSLSGTGEKITPDDETKQFVIDCCEAIPGLNFAGVDVMKVKHGDDEIKYFIEINYNPGEKIIDITGHNHYEDLLDYVEQNYRRKAAGKSNAEAMLTPGV